MLSGRTLRSFNGRLPARLVMTPGMLDRMIDWRVDDPRVGIGDPHTGRKERMQRQFTIELRVDYADNGKNDAMRKAMQAASRHIYATAALLSDGVKPQLAVFSDDYFQGHEEIQLLDDTIQQGIEELGGGADEGVSSELAGAVTK